MVDVDGEVMDDSGCGTCLYGKYVNEDVWGNPEYIICSLTKEKMMVEDICDEYRW